VSEDLLFDVATPLDLRVRVSRPKHPVLLGNEQAIEETLSAPDEVRRSRSDPDVVLFYRAVTPGRWMCAVAKRLDGEGFLVTAYPTDTVKEGERIWMR
jgi:hypothetical protein